MQQYEQCRIEMEQSLRERIDLSREVTDDEVRELIDDMMLGKAREYALTMAQRDSLGREIFDAVRKMDILQELIDCEDITEIMVNGTNSIFIERNGSLYEWEKHFTQKDKLESVIQKIVANCNRAVNEASPIVDARLENGARVNVVLSPIALNGPIITIRKFPQNPYTMEDLIRFGMLSEQAAEFLKQLVEEGCNLIISGSTGSGKTTFLNALSQYIPKSERIITIEDSAELQLVNHANLVTMETRNANMEGAKGITMRDLIKSSLRMRPDRIIVGEVRGGEALDMLQAMNTGHDGSMSTGHANSAVDMLARLETMVLMGMDLPLDAIRRQIASGVDVLIHLGRLRDRSRRVLEITEILGFDQGEILTAPLYLFEEIESQGSEEGSPVIGELKKVADRKCRK